MSAPTLTLAQLRKLGPCSDRLAVADVNLPARRRITAAQAREFGMSFGDILWAASAVARSDKDIDRRLRMWAADCAARVLHVYEAEHPADDRPRKAIEAARAYARGGIGDAARDAAKAAARDAAGAAARAAAWAAEESWQFDRLIEWLSDDEPEPWPQPEAQS